MPRGKSDPNITVVASDTYRGKPKPVILDDPTPDDLGYYEDEIATALRLGWEQGLDNLCVLIVWRGSKYAKEHGLDKSDAVLTIRPIAGVECECLTGIPAYRNKTAAELLPTFDAVLTRKHGCQLVLMSDVTHEGSVLAWKYSKKFRRLVAESVDLEAMSALERLTGVSRDQ